MPSLTEFLIVAALLFGLGMAGIILNRKNVIVLLMSIELILLAVNTNFIAFSYFLNNLLSLVGNDKIDFEVGEAGFRSSFCVIIESSFSTFSDDPSPIYDL